MNGVRLSVSPLKTKTKTKHSDLLCLPDLNITPQQLTTCLFVFLHFDLKLLMQNVKIISTEYDYPSKKIITSIVGEERTCAAIIYLI